MAEMAEQEEIAEQDPKFDCPINFQGIGIDLLYNPECYDDDGVICYRCIEERDEFPETPKHYTVLTVTIQTNDDFHIPQYLWENYRLYKPKRKEDDDYYIPPNRKHNIAYKYQCFGYFNEPDQKRNRKRTWNIMEAIVRDLKEWRLKGELLDIASFGIRAQRSPFRGPNNWNQMKVIRRN